MGVLADLSTSTGSQSTSLPSWYTTAQQDIVNQAKTNAAGAPQLSDTLAQNAFNQLGSANNPFTQASSTLNQIASGGANPFTADASGKMTPNTNTPLGGLYAAQQQQLQQLLPTTLAQPEAQNIGSGNFGSLRGQTANATAEGNALANLQANQLQNAIQNQSNAVNAASAAGQVNQTNIADLMNAGQTQMTSPFTTTANEANVIGSVSPGATVNSTATTTPLNQLSALLSGVGGLAGTKVGGSTLGDLFAGGLSNLFGGGSGAVNFGTTGQVPGSTDSSGTMDYSGGITG